MSADKTSFSLLDYSIRTTIDDEPGLLVATYGINAPGDSAYFSVTGEFYPQRGARRGSFEREPSIAGSIHNEIATALPWLKDLINAHLCDAITGEPMHAEANAWYWYQSVLRERQGQQESLPTGYADLDAPGRAAAYLGCDPGIFFGIDTHTDPESARKQFSAAVDTLRPAWRARAKYLREVYQLPLPAGFTDNEPAGSAHPNLGITLDADSVRAEITEARQLDDTAFDINDAQADVLLALDDGDIFSAISEVTGDDFWFAYDNARNKAINRLINEHLG